MTCYIRKLFSWLLLFGAIVLGLFLGLGILNPPIAAAAIRQLEEAPGQVVYQSRQTLPDQVGNVWQAIAFKRIRADGTTQVNLRLVGFPGVSDIDHAQPLKITNSLGVIFTAPDISSTIFTQANQSESNVGQYDLEPLLDQIQTEIPLQLTLPLLSHKTVSLSIAPPLIQEWQTVAHL